MTTTSSDSRPRRRFRFTLRTLFVVLTVLGCSLGWGIRQAHVVRRRLALCEQISRTGGVQWNTPWAQANELSWLRKLLGDKPVYSIRLPAGATPADAQQVVADFPEARHVFLRDDGEPYYTRP